MWKSKHHLQVEALNSYWNSVGTGNSAIQCLDPNLRAVVDQCTAEFHPEQMRQARRNDLEYLLLTEVQVRYGTDEEHSNRSETLQTGLPNSSAMRDSSRGPGRLAPTRRLLLPAACLMALAVVGAMTDTLDSWRPGGIASPTSAPPTIVAPTVGNETVLLELALPADVFPAESSEPGSKTGIWISLDTIPPNSSPERTGAVSNCCPGTIVAVIQSGTVVVTSSGIMHVGQGEVPSILDEIPAGTSARLAPGDFVVGRYEDVQSWTTGAEPVELVIGVVVIGIDHSGAHISDKQNHGFADATIYDAVPDGPYVLSVTRLAVREGDIVPAGPSDFAQVGLLEDWAGSIGYDSDGTLTVLAMDEPSDLYVLTLSIAPEETESQVPGRSEP